MFELPYYSIERDNKRALCVTEDELYIIEFPDGDEELIERRRKLHLDDPTGAYLFEDDEFNEHYTSTKEEFEEYVKWLKERYEKMLWKPRLPKG